MIGVKDNLKEKILSYNVRDYIMYIALAVIILIFTVFTKGLFLKSRNIVNLINQSGYVAILAIGMTSILILKHIDLSVGYVAGFCGAIAAYIMSKYHFNVWLTILLVLVIGLIIGLYHGVLVTYVGVPAFVVTLASMFIFRGALNLILADTGTINVSDDVFKGISNGYVPDIIKMPIKSMIEGIKFLKKIHLFTIFLGIVFIGLFIFFQIKKRKTKQKYEFEVVSIYRFVVRLILVSLLIVVITYILASHNGIPWTAVIVGIVLVIYNFILNKTKLGRYIYGIGCNEQASLLSGVNVKKVTLFVFCAMSLLAAVSGIMYTSRLNCATPTAGLGFEMDAIASAYIGGVAVSGGVGKVTNTIVGTLIIMSLTNGMNLLGVNISGQYIVKGIIFVLAVAVDVRMKKVAN